MQYLDKSFSTNKRRKLKKKTHLGPSYCRCCLLQTSLCLLIHQKYLYISISTEKTCRKKINYSPRAQKTRDASFGHFSHVWLCPNPRWHHCHHRCRAVVVLVVLLHYCCRVCCCCCCCWGQVWVLTHRKVHVFSSAKNNIYLINFGGEIGQSKSINLSENFRIA